MIKSCISSGGGKTLTHGDWTIKSNAAADGQNTTRKPFISPGSLKKFPDLAALTPPPDREADSRKGSVFKQTSAAPEAKAEKDSNVVLVAETMCKAPAGRDCRPTEDAPPASFFESPAPVRTSGAPSQIK